jgi:hypothetical protein
VEVMAGGNWYVSEVCFFDGLSSITLNGLLLWIVRSVVMDMYRTVYGWGTITQLWLIGGRFDSTYLIANS